MDFTKDINFNVNNLIKDQGFTLTYNGPLAQNSKDVYIHFGFDSAWKNSCHMKMEKAENGFSINIVPQDYSSLNFCFVDSNNNWDNNNGDNYSAPIHSDDEYIKTAYADTIEKTFDEVISSMYPYNFQKTINQLKAIISYKKLDFIRYFYNITMQPGYQETVSESQVSFNPDLRTIIGYQVLDFIRYFYNVNEQYKDNSFAANYDLTNITKLNFENAKIISDIILDSRERSTFTTPIIKEDSPFDLSTIGMQLLKDFTSSVPVSNISRSRVARKFDFSNAFEKYKIKKSNDSLALNFKHNFNLSDANKLCITGCYSYDNYSCAKEVSDVFVNHFADNRIKISGAVSNGSYTLSHSVQTAPTLFTIKGCYTLPALYTSTNVFGKVLEIGTELPTTFDNYYENIYTPTESTEMDSVAEEVINSILEDSKVEIVEEIVKPEPVETSYNVSYSTFTEVLKNSVSKELVNADAAYTIADETVSEESTIDSIYNIEFEVSPVEEERLELEAFSAEVNDSYIENINQILESVVFEEKEDIFDAFNTLQIQNISLSEQFNEIKTSENFLEHTSCHSLGYRIKKAPVTETAAEFTENIDSIFNYLESGITEQVAEVVTEELPVAENAYTDSSITISESILNALSSISTEENTFYDKTFAKAAKTDIDMIEYDKLSEEIQEELAPIQELQELELEKAKLELAFETPAVVSEEEYEPVTESALTVLPISSLTELDSVSRFYTLKRKIKLCLYKVFNVLPRIIKNKLFGYDE